MGQLDEQADKKMIRSEFRADYELAQRAVSGDLQAWEILNEHSYRKLRAYALMKDIRYGEDAVNRAFEAAQCRIGTYRGESSFEGWVWGIIKLQLKKIYAENARNGRLYDRCAVWGRYRDSCNPLDIAIRRERNACLWKAFGSLSKRQRMLVEFHALRGEGIKKVSARIGICWTEGKREYLLALKLLKHRFVCLYSGGFRGGF